MPKQKYDYKQLKLDYFQSDFEDVKGFMESIWRSYDWNCRKQTRGWWKDKQAYKEKILQKALDKKAEEEAENLDIPTDQLLRAKKTVIWLLMKKLKESIESWNINVSEQEKILKMIKTELWEPTNISKTDATIKSEPIDESLLIQN